MCGRLVVKNTGIEEFTDRIGAKWVQSDLFAQSHFNVTPGTTIPVVRFDVSGKPEGVGLHWGLVPSWAPDQKVGYKMINARGETVAEKPSFRSAFKSRRCLVLASGFYEWKREGKSKQPHLIQRKDGKPLAFAGLWERWSKGPVPLESTSIITINANELLSTIHDRMPVVVDESDWEYWLDPQSKGVQGLIRPWDSDKLEMFPQAPV